MKNVRGANINGISGATRLGEGSVPEGANLRRLRPQGRVRKFERPSPAEAGSEILFSEREEHFSRTILTKEVVDQGALSLAVP